VHTDNTPRSAIAKIRDLTEMKADYLLQGRCRIINIWRPIKHQVYDCGLALADGAKLQPADIIECERYRQDTKQYWDTMGVVKFREGFEWYYLSAHDPDDVVLFKNYDSDSSVPAPICLHTAFDLPASEIPPSAPTRESIEVHALVFTHPKSTSHGAREVASTLQHPLALRLVNSTLPTAAHENFGLIDLSRLDIDEAK
jgi:hypothetical protein